MESSSEYLFPIFISSTDYNLKDLRAELARYLSELGYRPILSSSEGFPDNSPNLEPWESCIPVLDKSFVMILVIDGKYGSPLPWPNSGKLFKDKKISPTHGEYHYAHKNFKRMLVFIRSEVMTYYQSYRQILKSMKGKNIDEIEQTLKKVLPEYIDFKTLQFVHEVKTTKPIPWIKEFDDITSIKKEVQKKMLNELAEIFLVKNMHLETVVQSFNKVLQSLSSEEQTKALEKIDIAKGLSEKVLQIEEYQKELDKTKQLLHDNQQLSKTEKTTYSNEIKKLQAKILKLEETSRVSPLNQFYIENGKIQLNDLSSINSQSLVNPAFSYLQSYYTKDGHFILENKKQCDGCGKQNNYPLHLALITGELHKCNNCARNLCTECFPLSKIIINSNCTECDAKKN
ncbi:hypothetical protein Flavo103_31300 [Flavobacterium collinsii]|uniref:DUF4062 domain-containing protein n=1 Tax=Flavobacterium collinsii TaxID=1114861 RepID=UPI0022CAB228|nr:DUF4062 domain-containing protein [Flavobacterium collinsii]GIQ59994.1 hypothetical protein Flavo103_31300 [Flavobacterium collinsii]